MAAVKIIGKILNIGFVFTYNWRTYPESCEKCLLVTAVHAQRLVVTHAPKYVSFQEQERPLPSSDISKVISHTLGINTQHDLNWNGLLQGSIFKRPKANVLVTIVMTEDTPALDLKGKADFPVDLDSPGVDVHSLMSRLQSTFMNDNPLFLDAALDNNMFDIRSEFDAFRKLPNTLRKMSDRLLDRDSVIQHHTLGTLNSSLPSDMPLIGELQMIQDVMNTVSSDESMMKSKTPDLFSFTVTGLQGVSKKHGSQSAQAKDASSLVTDFLHEMTENFKTIYKDNVVVEILMINPPKGLVRKSRSLMADPTPATIQPIDKDLYNLAPDYDDMYPAIFNIILWTMIFLAIATFAICYAIWNMDPGRDSIIYRMTTTRLKKE